MGVKSENKFDPVRGGRPQIVLESILARHCILKIGQSSGPRQGISDSGRNQSSHGLP